MGFDAKPKRRIGDRSQLKNLPDKVTRTKAKDQVGTKTHLSSPKSPSNLPLQLELNTKNVRNKNAIKTHSKFKSGLAEKEAETSGRAGRWGMAPTEE